MRVRISRWNPFITDRTVIRTIMPSAMPVTDITEMKEMKRVRCLLRVYLRPMKSSYELKAGVTFVKGPVCHKAPRKSHLALC